MVRIAVFLLCFLSFSVQGLAQKGKVVGVVKDDATGETLIGASVIYGPGQGVLTDFDGKFELELDYGEYNLTVSYVGFSPKSQKVTVDKGLTVANFKMGTMTLTEFEVVADIARDRETPVAFATVLPAQIEEELASQDLPMVLNSTPGVYATQQGGGDGDARITIRGFNQRNVAVMVDGIPVNDMENGWVYWSNWFGLDAVTRSIQVQRGLGASKIAIPSVGGTMNILTKGIDAKKGGSIKQEVGNNGFLRTSLGLTTGQMENGWGFTFAGSYKRGNGWVDETFTEGYFYYFKAEKKLGNHILGVSAMGAPQQHGQRSFKRPLTTFDLDYGIANGIDTSLFPVDTSYGLQYNQHWGTYETYSVNSNLDTTAGQTVLLRERINYYHKPQFSIRDFWSVSDKLYISNIAYLSVGRGGGTGAKNSISDAQLLENGQINWQEIYDANTGNAFAGSPFGDLSIDPTWSDSEHKSGTILRSSINNHFWWGFLSTFQYRQNDKWTYSGGIDLRSYKGQHYREVYDLIGGDYYIAPGDEYSENEERSMLRVGDKFGYHNDGLVRWGGLFGQAEYSTPVFSAFFNVSTALTGYKRIDYYKEKDVVIGDDVFSRAVDYGGVFFYDGTNGLSAYNGATVTYSGDTIFVDNVGSDNQDGFIVNPTDSFTIDSEESRYAETEWKYIPGYTIKMGGNYKVNEWNNVFVNVGHISKAQRFNNVISNENTFFEQTENERITAFELGYGLRKEKIALNVNGYMTQWKNKPATAIATLPDDPDTRIPVNLNGLNALHQGVEMDVAFKLTSRITFEGLVSLGDWRWTSRGNYIINNPANGNPVDTVQFNAQDIFVGDAAQSQYSIMGRYQFISTDTKKGYFKLRYTYFDRYYADFDPVDFQEGDPNYVDNFNPDGSPRQSWKTPAYGLVDGHVGFSFKVKGLWFHWRGSVLNLLDARYISDATNNDKFNALNPAPAFDASSAAIFYGQGRRFNTSLKITF